MQNDTHTHTHMPNLIDNLPLNVTEKINTHCISGFSHYVKLYLIDRYQLECVRENCYICSLNP